MAGINRAFLGAGATMLARALEVERERQRVRADLVGEVTDDLLAAVKVNARTVAIRTGLGTGKCVCMKTISKNKKSCRECAEEVK